ncbi:MAG: succinate dehydrogenase [Deltaproteobacteria bacterium]|nr:MAG: succinate dehydrogenase [Deltaproteobacteria bacterium]
MAFVVKVSRFDPSVDRAVYLETFRIPLPAESKWTAMDVLDYIHLHLDSSLSYCRHSACNRGICARCAARINGRTRLLCEYIVPAQGEVLLEPVQGKTVVKDLVGTER